MKFVETHTGGLDVLVFDFADGGFVRDISYLSRVTDVGIGKDVDALDAIAFAQLVDAQRRSIAIRWEPTGDAEFPYRATAGDEMLTIRVNDLPAEPLYTVLADGHEREHLDDWPPLWIKPAAR